MAQFDAHEKRALQEMALFYLREKANYSTASVTDAWLEAVVHFMLKKNMVAPISMEKVNGT